MRVCMVVPYDLAEQGGVKRHAFQLATALRALGDDVTVMGPSSAGTDDPAVHVFGGVVNIRSNGSDNRLAVLVPPWRIRDWLRARAFDVVHVHEPLCPLLGPYAAMFAGAAGRVATFHAFAEHEGLAPRVLRWWSGPFVLRHVDRAIAVSEPAARYARFVWKRPLSIIPNGIALGEPAAPAPPHDGALRLLFVGHWRDPRKGLPVLLAALAQLHDRGLAVTLDVVGAGPDGAEPPQLAGVAFHGPVASEHEIAAHLARCDVLVAPALGQESFGIVLLEAMAAARPIVCSDIAGFREVVGRANARFALPGSPEALATAIAELAEQPQLRRALAEANLVHVRRFAWSELVHRVRAEYRAAIAARGGTLREAS